METDKGGRDTTAALLAVIGALTAVVICITVIVIIIISVVTFFKHKTLPSKIASSPSWWLHHCVLAVQQEPKESRNPIYEGPLYESLEETLSPLPPPLSSVGRRGSGECVSSNLYTSSLPVPIPTSLETTQQGTLLTPKTQPQDTPGPGEEDTYTVMSPAGHAARDGYSFTPYMEDRAGWIGHHGK